jgi:hypothetical protein
MPIAPPETEIVTAWRVSCDGGGGAWVIRASGCRSTGIPGCVECGYCDKKFVHADFADAPGLGLR